MLYYHNANENAFGRATSPDGITWTRHVDNPVLTNSPGSISDLVIVDDVYYLYYSTVGTWGMGVITGTVGWE